MAFEFIKNKFFNKSSKKSEDFNLNNYSSNSSLSNSNLSFKVESEEEIDFLKVYSHLYDIPIFKNILGKLKKNTSLETQLKVHKILDEINQGGFYSLDGSRLQTLIFSGIPDELPVLRTLVWKLALNYPRVPIIHTPKWQNEIDLKRKEYYNLVKTHYQYINQHNIQQKKNKESGKEISPLPKSDHPLSSSDNSSWNNYFKDNELIEEIHKDVRRTRAQMSFFFMPADTSLEVSNEDIAIKADYTIEHTKSTKNKIEKDFESHGDLMTRILYIYAKEHPHIRYVQGMNEVLATIYYQFCLDNDCDNNQFNDLNSTLNKINIEEIYISNDEKSLFENNTDKISPKSSANNYLASIGVKIDDLKSYQKIEADSYNCFCNLMEEFADLFIREKDQTRSGIQTRIKGVNLLLREIDKQVYNQFNENGVEIQFFMFRWYTLLFTQEYELPDVIRLWDSILSFVKIDCNKITDKFMFLNFLSLAAILMKKEDVINEDFAGIMMAYQNTDFLEVGYHIKAATKILEYYRDKYINK
jgi:hypothetical protein